MSSLVERRKVKKIIKIILTYKKPLKTLDKNEY
jgi:hypothetical protein